MNCPPVTQKPRRSPGLNRDEGGKVPGKPELSLSLIGSSIPRSGALFKESAMAEYQKQRRKRAVPKPSRKGRVDKSRVRQAIVKPHENKYVHKKNGE